VKKFLRIIVPILVVLTLTFIFAGAALADDPTTVTVTWNGAGGIGTNVNSGDSNAGFSTLGNAISGEYTAMDSNDNPYTYGVDSFSSYLNASVTNGNISTGIARVNSYAGYGNGGQLDTAFVGVDGGTGSIAFRSVTNYAAMTDATYTYQLPGGHNIVVDASAYTIDRAISDGRGNSGEVYATGNGAATLGCMSSEASGCWNLSLGCGAGCYTNANFQAAGANGHFEATGVGNNSVVFNGLGISSGGGTLQVVANWLNSFNINDYSLTAH
jgi:hypothetical protein